MINCCRTSSAVCIWALATVCLPDRSFDCVVSINTIHNFDRAAFCARCVRSSASQGRAFVQVDPSHAEQKTCSRAGC